MAKIKRNSLLFTQQNFRMFLKMYADTVLEHGEERAKDIMFENMLNNELFINLIFCVSISKLNEIIMNPIFNIRDFTEIRD